MISFEQYLQEDAKISQADAKERQAFTEFLAKLEPLNAEAFVRPMGSDAGFPDFGFTYQLDGKQYDIHIEYKMNDKAQMGSMRDWRFDGAKFYTPAKGNTAKEELIAVMNGSRDALGNAKRLLGDFKKVFGSRIKEISSAMLTPFKDKEDRKARLIEFTKLTDKYSIANIDDTKMGDNIIRHYKTKFTKVKRASADQSSLYFMIGNKLYLLDGVPPPMLEETLGGQIPRVGSLKAKLEVRLQPRGLNSSKSKPVSIDVMASFRLSGGFGKGLQV